LVKAGASGHGGDRVLLRSRAGEYARVALANVAREFPHLELLRQAEPRSVPRPRELHPSFYGSLDWHSCVEMHWLLVRLLRTVPSEVPEAEIRAVLNERLAAERLAAEAGYFADPAQSASERPYGWGWALMLMQELAAWQDADAPRWAENLQPLAEVFVGRYLAWLPDATYPVRHGVHTNSAFGLSLALPFARTLAERGESRLLDAITETATRWFIRDSDYPAGWEPSGWDFLSPALTEAELMASLLPRDEFAAWLDRFLPQIANGEPASLFSPAIISDPADGHIAHLHGLNLSRAWCWQRLASALPETDRRVPIMLAVAETNADASLDQAVASDYVLEHWLACYAVLLLTAEPVRA
jgi:hypothetical protein